MVCTLEDLLERRAGFLYWDSEQRLERARYGARVMPLEDGGAIITGTTPSIFWTVRDIAAVGPDAEVLGGPRLKEEFLRFIRLTVAKYR